MTGDKFLTINYDKNIPIEYNEMKKIFDKNIQPDRSTLNKNKNPKLYKKLQEDIKWLKTILEKLSKV